MNKNLLALGLVFLAASAQAKIVIKYQSRGTNDGFVTFANPVAEITDASKITRSYLIGPTEATSACRILGYAGAQDQDGYAYTSYVHTIPHRLFHLINRYFPPAIWQTASTESDDDGSYKVVDTLACIGVEMKYRAPFLNLIAAVRDNDTTRAIVAMKQGGNPNLGGVFPNTPTVTAEDFVFKAIDRNNAPLAIALIRDGANVDHEDAVNHAIDQNNIPMVTALLKAKVVDGSYVDQQGAAVNAIGYSLQKSDSPQMVRAILAADSRYDIKSVLTIAAKAKRFEVVKALVTSGAVSVNAQDDNGWTALMNASLNLDREMQAWLLAHGANPKLRNHDGDNEDMIYRAAKAGQNNGATSDDSSNKIDVSKLGRCSEDNEAPCLDEDGNVKLPRSCSEGSEEGSSCSN